ncbi:chemotaxis protein CheY [Desulfonema ishimotonii]|uniref:Chemotaxis protein CheY n=1 Tax=Desulfonema ishimotonii TaxID=45657 RepID=A0A401FZE0_9BACT|nr:response regulator [Desulfonema ishimotonii]GBC62317.1 chemotaxis protein CheY [Desulfonema ishimotonii]
MKKKKVLVVDDELDMRIFISTVFETSGYEAVAARDGREGLRRAREMAPDLIVLDIMMPGEGGVLMYRHLRTDEQLREIPVIMLSGVGKKTFYHYLSMMNIKPEDAIPEPEAYLEKPPNPEELLEIADIVIRKTTA